MRLSLALAAAAVLVAALGIVDHTWKAHRIGRAEVSEWYCLHRGTRCGGPSTKRIERRWNEREIGYEAAVAVLAGAAVLLVAARTLRR
jgi:hypothetical protein